METAALVEAIVEEVVPVETTVEAAVPVGVAAMRMAEDLLVPVIAEVSAMTAPLLIWNGAYIDILTCSSNNTPPPNTETFLDR